MIRAARKATLRGRTSIGWIKRIRVHPLFLALLGLSVIVGLWREMCILFLIVMLHELGHAGVAEYLGYEVESVSLLPFGGVARLSYGNIGFQPRHEAAIAVAGPCVNLLLAALVWALYSLNICSLDFVHTVVGFNAWIALFNLLPGLPLDGGRVLRAARSRSVGFERATREAYNMAIFIAIGLLLLGAAALWMGSPHIGIVILGFFLLVSALTGRRDTSMETVRFLDDKKKSLHGKPLQVRALVTPSSATIRDVVKQFAPDRYHMVYVFSDSGSVRTVLEEDELLSAVFAGQWMKTIQEWIETE